MAKLSETGRRLLVKKVWKKRQGADFSAGAGGQKQTTPETDNPAGAGLSGVADEDQARAALITSM